MQNNLKGGKIDSERNLTGEGEALNRPLKCGDESEQKRDVSASTGFYVENPS